MASSAPRRSASETLAALGSSREVGLTDTDVQARLARDGPNEIRETSTHPIRRLLGRFWGPSAWMLEAIVVLSAVLGRYVDVAVASALLVVNAVLGFVQEARASSALSLLRQRLRVIARALRSRSWQAVEAGGLVVGDIVRVRAGDFVPADLQVVDGAVAVDQSMLTGESHEIERGIDDEVWSGSMISRGEATAVVVATGTHTYFGRTAELVQTARPKLHIDEVVARVVRWLLLIVGILVGITVAASIAERLPLVDILPLALVLLMSAIPVALPVMFTVSTALGSVELARHGVLITRLSAVEDAANMNVLCVDKTGTLTQNRLTLDAVTAEPGFAADDVVRAGALASSEADRDPIDLAFLRAADDRKLLDERPRVVSFAPFSPQTRRTEAVVEHGGVRSRTTKGALRTIAELVGLESSVVTALEARAKADADRGARVLAVARADGEDALRLVGLACLRDPLRADSRRLVDELRSLGIEVVMLTGDALPVARHVAQELGLGEIHRAPELRSGERAVERLGGGLAEVFPEDKFRTVESLQKSGRVVGMTGDGVNDAPALRQAEVGIAVSTASDVAKAAAGVVLVTEGLVGIVELVRGGRAIYQRVLTWIVNKISRTILKAAYVAAAFLATGEFVVSALAMVLLVFMTDFVKISLATDRVRPSSMPESWKIAPLVRVAVLLGVVMTGEALALLAVGRHAFDLGGGRLHTFAFETLLFFALFSILSIRERRAFWRSRPSTTLLLAIAGDAALGGLLALFGLGELPPLPGGAFVTVVGVALVCVLGINDGLKSMLLRRKPGVS